MVRLIYRHYCDRCHRVIEVEEHELVGLTRTLHLPHPRSHEQNGRDLCRVCAPIVDLAVSEAMK